MILSCSFRALWYHGMSLHPDPGQRAKDPVGVTTAAKAEGFSRSFRGTQDDERLPFYYIAHEPWYLFSEPDFPNSETTKDIPLDCVTPHT